MKCNRNSTRGTHQPALTPNDELVSEASDLHKEQKCYEQEKERLIHVRVMRKQSQFSLKKSDSLKTELPFPRLETAD